MTPTDINECAGPNDCQQNCINQQGGYRCSCYNNYILNADNRTCRGMIYPIIDAMSWQ